MVDLRATLLAATAAGIIDPETRARLAKLAKSWPFPRRNLAVLGEAGGPALTAWIGGHVVRQKRADALALVAELVAIGTNRSNRPSRSPRQWRGVVRRWAGKSAARAVAAACRRSGRVRGAAAPRRGRLAALATAGVGPTMPRPAPPSTVSASRAD